VNRPSFVFLLWGLELAALTLVGILIIGFEGIQSPLLLGGSAATFVVLAGYLALRRDAADPLTEPRAVPDLSLATVWLGIAGVLLAVSVELGLWLALISAGMAAVGVVALVRELRAERSLASRVSTARKERR
jgi:xanthine/uracil/vitamin C permease (AzgA family)